jgi:hypothetical protein
VHRSQRCRRGLSLRAGTRVPEFCLQVPFPTTAYQIVANSRGVHNWYQTDDANIVLPTTPDGLNYFWPTPIGSGTVVDPLVGQTLDARWNGNSSFNGLETQITQSPWHGLQGQLSYTWSRCIDTSSGSAASDQYRNSLNVDLYIAPRTHRGPCDTNVGQNLTINAIYNIPGDQSRHGIAGWATNGWQTGGIFTAASGAPFSVTIGGDPLGTNAAIPFDFPGSTQRLRQTHHQARRVARLLPHPQPQTPRPRRHPQHLHARHARHLRPRRRRGHGRRRAQIW